MAAERWAMRCALAVLLFSGEGPRSNRFPLHFQQSETKQKRIHIANPRSKSLLGTLLANPYP